MGYYDKTVDKDVYQRYLDRKDDEYWNDFVNTYKENKVGNIEEALRDKENSRIHIKSNGKDRVTIDISRQQALELFEDLSDKEGYFSYHAGGTLRRLLRGFFVDNRDITSEDLYY